MPLPTVPNFDDGTYYNGIGGSSPTDIWAVGNGNSSDRGPTAIYSTATAAHWNGAAWTLNDPPAPPDMLHFHQLFGVAALPGGSAFAVGNSDAFADNGGDLIDSYASGAWAYGSGAPFAFTSANPISSMNAVAAVSGSDVWAAGSATDYGNVYEQWNGVSWTIHKPFGERTAGGKTNAISALTVVSASNIWAVGTTSWQDPTLGHQSDSLIEHWNGTRSVSYTHLTLPTTPYV